MSTNLWTETIRELNEHGKTWNDVRFVCGNDFSITKPNFETIARNTNYDSGYGRQIIASDLKIVGDYWWLERHEYDGAEWWEYKEMPKHTEYKHIHNICGSWSTITGCNKENDEEYHNNLVTENDTEVPKYITEWASSSDLVYRQEEIVKRIKEEYEITDRPVCEDAISRADTIKAMCRECTQEGRDECRADCTEVAVVKSMPSVEPERPKGEWVDRIFDGCLEKECDQCGEMIDAYIFRQNRYNFCPNCGADMRGDTE